MRFQEIITEGRDAPLYHGTSSNMAVQILLKEQVDAVTQQKLHRTWDEPFKGVSMSRDIRVAFRFGQVVFEFDQRLLSQRNKIVPVDFWGTGTEPEMAGLGRRQGRYAEAEEFVVGNVDLWPSCKAILMMERQRRSISMSTDNRAYFKILMEHPLLRIVGPEFNN